MSVSLIGGEGGLVQEGTLISASIPSTTAGTSIPGHASIDTFGVWTELLATVSFDLYITGVSVRAGHFDTGHAVIGIGVGAAASEVAKAQHKAVFELPATNTTLPAAHIPLWPWVPIPAGTRLAARVALGKTSSSVLLTVHYVPAASVVTP